MVLQHQLGGSIEGCDWQNREEFTKYFTEQSVQKYIRFLFTMKITMN